MILTIVLIYSALLFVISRITARRATNESFFRADRRSPWYMVAFGMVGASISGVTFVSVPGMVMRTQMTYLQTCMGFVLGYVVVALVLLPLYYRLDLTSIYAFLGKRLGNRSHIAGSSFFLLSKMAGAAVKFYVVCIILQRFVFEPMGVPFAATVPMLVLLIWLYTRQGGIKTLVWTDSLQTLCLLVALLMIMHALTADMGMTAAGAARAIADSELSRVFVFDDWLTTQNFWKQFVSGIFIVVVMTGLDQDMMQKNLTCRSLRDAQKDMCCYGLAFVPVNLLFLSVGVLLTMWYQQQGISLPSSGDELLPHFIAHAADSSLLTAVFVLGIVAASFSSADSALTSLTTIYCVDICRRPDNGPLRKRTHLAMCAIFVMFILLFNTVNSTSLIDAVYIIVSYTYGPLLGLFAFGLLTNRDANDRLAPYIAVASPLLCYALDFATSRLANYHFGYELLMLNGLLTFCGLYITSSQKHIITK
ncbi:MAG: sodium:solute symporter [Prevotella sp.]|nr:sodium:solute symporter [Prevotella sp.]